MCASSSCPHAQALGAIAAGCGLWVFGVRSSVGLRCSGREPRTHNRQPVHRLSYLTKALSATRERIPCQTVFRASPDCMKEAGPAMEAFFARTLGAE